MNSSILKNDKEFFYLKFLYKKINSYELINNISFILIKKLKK